MSVPRMSRLYHLSDIESRPYYSARRVSEKIVDVERARRLTETAECVGLVRTEATTRDRSTSSGQIRQERSESRSNKDPSGRKRCEAHAKRRVVEGSVP